MITLNLKSFLKGLISSVILFIILMGIEIVGVYYGEDYKLILLIIFIIVCVVFLALYYKKYGSFKKKKNDTIE